MKRLPSEINNILKNEDLLTKVKFYFAQDVVDQWYDKEEGTDSKSKSYLNPVTAKLYVAVLSAEKVLYKTQGKHTEEAKIIICDKKYKKYFKNASKIEISDNEYSAYDKATGKFTIETHSHKRIRVTLYRK